MQGTQYPTMVLSNLNGASPQEEFNYGNPVQRHQNKNYCIMVIFLQPRIIKFQQTCENIPTVALTMDLFFLAF